MCRKQDNCYVTLFLTKVISKWLPKDFFRAIQGYSLAAVPLVATRKLAAYGINRLKILSDSERLIGFSFSWLQCEHICFCATFKHGHTKMQLSKYHFVISFARGLKTHKFVHGANLTSVSKSNLEVRGTMSARAPHPSARMLRILLLSTSLTEHQQSQTALQRLRLPAGILGWRILPRTAMLRFSKTGSARLITSSRCKCADLPSRWREENPESPPLAPQREIRGHRFSRKMWRENPAASQVRPPTFNQARKDIRVCWCIDIPMFFIEAGTQNISKDFWKPYMENNTFQQRIHVFLRLGSRGATVQRKDAGSLYNGLPRPRTECIVGPYVETCMFKKHILKIRKFFFVSIFLPLPPPPMARRDMWSLI